MDGHHDDKRQRLIFGIADSVETQARARGDHELLAKYERTRLSLGHRQEGGAHAAARSAEPGGRARGDAGRVTARGAPPGADQIAGSQ